MVPRPRGRLTVDLAAVAAAVTLCACADLAAAATSLSSSSSSSSSPARLRSATMRLPVSETGPGNLLPTFRWQAGAAEGSASITVGATQANPAEATMDDSCPDSVFDGAMPDLRDPALPHLIQDGYTSDRKVTDVPVWVLENDVAVATITPQWGGKVWDFRLKATADRAEVPLVFRNPIHQSVNSGVLKAYTAGGIEWNWSPGIIGHTVFTESPVHLARVATDQGDIARVYEFDRFNGTVWQVDIYLNGTTLWVHPKVTNPHNHDVPGYWWTNAGLPTTTKRGVCRPKPGLAYGQLGSRALVPATHVVNNAVGKLNLAPWPRYRQTCCAGDQAVVQDDGNGGAPVALPDLSYPGNHLGDIDNFFVTYGLRPWIAMVDRTSYGDAVHGVVHGHDNRLQGTKMWTWGQDQMTDWTQMAPRADGLGSGWGGCFSEQQTGVMPTQSQHFTLKARSSVKFTEFFAGLEALPSHNASALYSDDYRAATDAVQAVLDASASVGAGGFARTDRWLESHADDPVAEEDVLVPGQPWGALEAAAGAAFPPSTRFVATRPPESEAWWHLVESGTFAPSDLDAPTPQSFATSARWQALIRASAGKRGETWLHLLHLAVAAADAGDGVGAHELVTRSMALRPTALAYRILANLAPPAESMRFYDEALRTASQHNDSVGMRLRRNLASEVAEVLLANGDSASIESFVSRLDKQSRYEREADQVVKARVAAAVNRGDATGAVALLSNHSFPTCSAYRDDVIAMWNGAWETAESTRIGRGLTPVERKRLRAAHPPPVTLGARYDEWPNEGGAPRRL